MNDSSRNDSSRRTKSASVVLILLGAVRLLAQTSPHANAHMDWGGYYAIAPAKSLKGFTPVNQQLDPLIMAHLQPWALEKIKETNGVADDMGAICNLAGIFRHPSTIGAFYWLPVPGKIIMAFTRELETAGVRRIYLTDQHPKNLPATYLGHSIGHWEAPADKDSGDTLVVDTIGFNDKTWLYSGLEPHSEELHVVERIRLVDNGTLLEVASTVEDRKALTSPYMYSRYYRKTAEEFHEEICNGDAGEQELWLGFNKSALKHGFKPPKD
jgi:hypothetical protein